MIRQNGSCSRPREQRGTIENGHDHPSASPEQNPQARGDAGDQASWRRLARALTRSLRPDRSLPSDNMKLFNGRSHEAQAHGAVDDTNTIRLKNGATTLATISSSKPVWRWIWRRVATGGRLGPESERDHGITVSPACRSSRSVYTNVESATGWAIASVTSSMNTAAVIRCFAGCPIRGSRTAPVTISANGIPSGAMAATRLIESSSPSSTCGSSSMRRPMGSRS